MGLVTLVGSSFYVLISVSVGMYFSSSMLVVFTVFLLGGRAWCLGMRVRGLGAWVWGLAFGAWHRAFLPG